MRFLIESSNANYNWGDASMLHATVQRITSLFDDVQITLLKPHAAFDEEYDYDNVESLERRNREGWHLQRPIWSPLDKKMPSIIDHLAIRWPRFKNTITRGAMLLKGHDVGERGEFLQRFNTADALIVSGGGFINDCFNRTAERVLNLVMLAQSRDIPIFMFGQGIGPIRTDRLWAKARRALPAVRQIALREGKFSSPLLQQLGVSGSQVTVTGDDSVALAYSRYPESLGSAIGVNLRDAYYSELPESGFEELARGLSRAATSLGSPLLPVPIEYEGKNSDVDSICKILTAANVETDGGASLRGPDAVIEQVGRCRVVVTGSYHGGVFALSQGIPIVGLFKSAYYEKKFKGLADMFGVGCTILRVDRTDLVQAVAEAVRESWQTAPELRPQLLETAEHQVKQADVAYDQFADHFHV